MRMTAAAALSLAGLLFVACGDDSPTAPTATNRAPTVLQEIAEQTVLVGDSVQLDMQSYFMDPNGDPLTYQATSSNTRVATVHVAGTTVTLSAVSMGTANVAVTARDPGGLSATQSFRVSGEWARNRPPEVSRSIPDQTLKLDEKETVRIDLGRYFTDPDGDTLTYEAISRNEPVATVRVSRNTLTLRARRLGRAYIRVTARDPDGRSAGQRFLVTVEQGGPAAEVDITNCEATGNVDPRVTIEGFVRARRRLLAVSVTGWVQSEVFEVGTDRLGEIRQGQRKNFRIAGTSPIPLFSSFTCGVSVHGREAAFGGPESVEQITTLQGVGRQRGP